MKKLLLLFVVATSLSAFCQDSVLLRANYNEGDEFLIDLEQSQNMGAAGGMDMKIKMNMSIIKKEGDSFTAASKISTIKMNMLQGGRIMDFDSTKKEEDLDETGKMFKQQFDPMLKALITTKVTNRGEATDIKVEPMAPGMEEFLKQSSSIKYPEEKVSVGSSWSTELNQQGMKIVTKYTVSKIIEGKVYLDVTGDVSGMGAGKVTGAIVIDATTGVQDTANTEVKVSANGAEVIITAKVKTTKI